MPQNLTDPEDPTSAPVDNAATLSGSSQPSGTPPAGDDWEQRYKGLQKVASKKDATITDLQTKLDKLATDLEEIRTSSTGTTAQRDELARARTELEQQLATVKSERDRMEITLRQQNLLITEFPALSKLTKFIPSNQDDNAFRASAKELHDEFQAAVSAAVKAAMTGSTPPQPKPKQDMATEAEEDQLWKTVTSLAGVPGKEKEFAEARERWTNLQQAKNK